MREKGKNLYRTILQNDEPRLREKGTVLFFAKKGKKGTGYFLVKKGTGYFLLEKGDMKKGTGYFLLKVACPLF